MSLNPQRISKNGTYHDLIMEDLRRLERTIKDRRIRQSRPS